MSTATEEEAIWFKGWFSAILENVESVVRGKTNQVALVLSCFFAEGHLLLEDKPGRSPRRSRASGAGCSSPLT